MHDLSTTSNRLDCSKHESTYYRYDFESYRYWLFRISKLSRIDRALCKLNERNMKYYNSRVALDPSKQASSIENKFFDLRILDLIPNLGPTLEGRIRVQTR